jgi:hypothetical protein
MEMSMNQDIMNADLQFQIVYSFHSITTMRKIIVSLKFPSEGFKEEIVAEVNDSIGLELVVLDRPNSKIFNWKKKSKDYYSEGSDDKDYLMTRTLGSKKWRITRQGL